MPLTFTSTELFQTLPLLGEQELGNTIKDYGRKLLTVDTPTELAPTVSVTISQDGVISSVAQTGTKSKKKGNKGKTKKAKGGVAKVIAKPEQSNKTGAFQKNEFTSLENVYTKRTSEGARKLN